MKIMAVCSIVGAWLSDAIGGMDKQVNALVVLVVLDYATGMLAAWKTKQLSSQRGYKGIIKKVSIFVAIMLANLVDMAMGIQVLRSMAIFGFAGVEATSLVENIDRMGYGEFIPPFLRDKLAQIRADKGVSIK
jgi:toxin secretion/phage lysis holin